MPFIEVKTNRDIADSLEEIKAELGRAITAIPGKSEAWLMVELKGNCAMYFKGSDEPCAMFDVSVFGSASAEDFEKLTGLLCGISEKYLGVPAGRTYVKYAEVENWGYNGFNF